MRKLLPILLLGLAPILGAGLGVGMRLATAPHVEPEAEPDTDKAKPEQKARREGKAKHGAAPSYMKFSRQFVTPVLKDGVPSALVILDIQVETEPDAAESSYALEPKLRDEFVLALMRAAAEGRLADAASDPAAIAALKEDLLAAAHAVIGDGARAVLVTDVGVQPL